MSTSESTELKEVWRALFPRVPLPADEQWALWILRHGFTTARDGLADLATKYQSLKGAMDREYMLKFASSVMNHITRERQEREKNAPLTFEQIAQALDTMGKVPLPMVTGQRQ